MFGKDFDVYTHNSTRKVRDGLAALVAEFEGRGAGELDRRLSAACMELVDAGQIVFVDDSQANVDAARAAGWRAHRYTDALNLAAALTDEDVL